MVLFTLEIISSTGEKAMASEIGLTETTMKVNGSLIRGLATATRNGLPGMFTKAPGSRTSDKAKDHTFGAKA